MLSEVTKVKLLAQQIDSLGYTTYVFEILDSDECNRFLSKYIMCTKWPNWNHRYIKIGEIGYLSFTVIEAGKDFYYALGEMHPYNCNTIQFNKFIEEQPISKHEFKL